MTEFRALHPARDLAEAQATASTLVGDAVITEQTWQMLGSQKRTGRSPVFAYQSSYASPYSPLASHVADVPFAASFRRDGRFPEAWRTLGTD